MQMGTLLFLDGKIDILKSYEGIEGLSIDITGGEISVLASDDGMNAAGGNDGSGLTDPGGEISLRYGRRLYSHFRR